MGNGEGGMVKGEGVTAKVSGRIWNWPGRLR